MDDARAREVFMRGGENPTDQAGRFRVDVAVGADESSRNRAHPGHDARCARVEAAALRRHCVYIVIVCERKSAGDPTAEALTPARTLLLEHLPDLADAGRVLELLLGAN